jgi:tripartite-type tricarboxylate transporter receptor subunit TctC
MDTSRRNVIGMCAAGAAAALGIRMPAYAWTSRPVRVIAPAPPGGTIDMVARIFGAQLSASIGQPVVIENRPGAGGVIGVQAMLTAPADGLTLMVTSDNVFTEVPHVIKGGFHPLKDVRPLAALARADQVLVAAPTIPASDMKELVAAMKARTSAGSFASHSAGTSSHYAGMILNKQAGLNLQHVPFAGAGPALVQLMAGHIDIMFDGLQSSLPYITAGKLKALGVGSRTRSRHLPNVATFAEQGYTDIAFGNWFGVYVSSHVPGDVAERIAAEARKAAASPKPKEQLLAAGFELVDEQTPEQLAALLRADHERNAAIVKAFDIKVNG